MWRAPSCPDESAFADLAAGRLMGADRDAFDLHLDQCSACTELLAFLASPPGYRIERQRGSSSARDSILGKRDAWWHTDDAAISVTLLAAQIFWTAILAWSVVHCTATERQAHMLWSLRLIFGYVSVVGACGSLVGVLSVLSVFRRRNSASRLVLIQALICFATLTMAPLARVTIARLRRRKH